jgi:hypothetical protein
MAYAAESAANDGARSLLKPASRSNGRDTRAQKNHFESHELAA